MVDIEQEQLQPYPEWAEVLERYTAREAALRQSDPDGTGWVPRLMKLEDVDADRLSRVHGRLIALGLLQFQVTDRTLGLQYKVSPEGRRALMRVVGVESSDTPENEPEPAEESAAA